MPVWHAQTKRWVAEGRLDVLGVTQEQHAERCRLFAQWQGLDWPILHDPINLLGNAAVPTFVVLDDRGVVRGVNPSLETFEQDFLGREFLDEPGVEVHFPDLYAHSDDRRVLRAEAEQDAGEDTGARAWKLFGDASILWGGPGAIDDAIEAYDKALSGAEDPALLFRLGVAFRARHESAAAEPGDFQRAVDAWTRALELNPNQYIWRRRIQQFGPRLRDKPYPFYDWVDGALEALAARGETPVVLDVMPYGAELAAPSRAFVSDTEGRADANPDPEGKVRRADAARIAAEVTLVPPRAKPGAAVRVHVTLTPRGGAYWNNEADPLRIWIDPPAGWEVSRRLLEAAGTGQAAESRETRRLDFEALVPKAAAAPGAFTGFALFNTCDERGGVCRYVRYDLAFEVELGP